jgi:hypothetical protein
MRGHCLMLLLVVFGACAKRVPEISPHPSTPHITWTITEGYAGGNEVCRSTEPATACTLTLSDQRANRRFGAFHLFLHAGAIDTRYTGTLDVGFLGEDPDPAHQHTHTVDRIVSRGSDPVGVSSTGIARANGTYYVDLALMAAPAKGSGPSMPIKERIRVDVK